MQDLHCFSALRHATWSSVFVAVQRAQTELESVGQRNAKVVTPSRPDSAGKRDAGQWAPLFRVANTQLLGSNYAVTAE